MQITHTHKQWLIGLLLGASGYASSTSSNEAPASEPPTQLKSNDTQSTAKPAATGNATMDLCFKNFNVDGSYLQGYRFRTNTILRDVTKNTVFAYLAATTAEEGWIITSSDSTIGVLSANHTRGTGQDAKTQVLSYSVIPTTGNDVKVSVTLSTPADLFGSGRNEDTLKQQMCKAIENAAR